MHRFFWTTLLAAAALSACGGGDAPLAPQEPSSSQEGSSPEKEVVAVTPDGVASAPSATDETPSKPPGFPQGPVVGMPSPERPDLQASSPATQPPAVVTVKDTLINMEASGVTPALDRTNTIAGTDQNTNGVRDDIDAYVGGLTDTDAQKRALLRLSKAMTTAMSVVVTDADGLRRATAQIEQGVACVWKTYPVDQADQKVLEIRKTTVNTRLRFDAYMAYNAAVSGTVVKLSREVNCD